MVLNQAKQFLHSWKEGVIEIGKTYLDGADYKKCAEEFLSTHYAFAHDKVLFKPTFTKEVIFRNSQEQALSYFVKGDIKEDNGFALKPWEAIELVELNVLPENNFIIAMGALSFKPYDSDANTLVAFTFLLASYEGLLKIKAHHSSPIS